jgi:hypothetical protein
MGSESVGGVTIALALHDLTRSFKSFLADFGSSCCLIGDRTCELRGRIVGGETAERYVFPSLCPESNLSMSDSFLGVCLVITGALRSWVD